MIGGGILAILGLIQQAGALAQTGRTRMAFIATAVMRRTPSHRLSGHLITAGQRFPVLSNHQLNTALVFYDVAVVRPQGMAPALALESVREQPYVRTLCPRP